MSGEMKKKNLKQNVFIVGALLSVNNSLEWSLSIVSEVVSHVPSPPTSTIPLGYPEQNTGLSYIYQHKMDLQKNV